MNVNNSLSPTSSNTRRRSVLLLLLIPFLGTLWVSSYTFVKPEIWGIPFFYWYQFMWIGISAAITIIVYVVEGSAHAERASQNGTGSDGER